MGQFDQSHLGELSYGASRGLTCGSPEKPYERFASFRKRFHLGYEWVGIGGRSLKGIKNLPLKISRYPDQKFRRILTEAG